MLFSRNPMEMFTNNYRLVNNSMLEPQDSSSSTHLRSLGEGGLSVHGARFFNCLPQQLRNMTNVELPQFKKKLD